MNQLRQLYLAFMYISAPTGDCPHPWARARTLPYHLEPVLKRAEVDGESDPNSCDTVLLEKCFSSGTSFAAQAVRSIVERVETVHDSVSVGLVMALGARSTVKGYTYGLHNITDPFFRPILKCRTIRRLLRCLCIRLIMLQLSHSLSSNDDAAKWKQSMLG